MPVSQIYNERELLQLVANGDMPAFRQLFDAYKNRLYAAALKITRSEYAAEELVQEIFMALWEGRASLHAVDNPPAYIFTVAYNKTFRYLKKKSADSNFLRSLVQITTEEHSATEEWLDVRESAELIRQAVDQLPPQRQLIYRLSREKGLSHEEIARQLNISPLTVKKQISLALQGIRSQLGKSVPLLALFFLQ